MNSVSKMFTNILTIRLQKWAENKNVIVESQAGFRRHYSTIDYIFSLKAFIQKYLCQTRGNFIVYLSTSAVLLIEYRTTKFGILYRERV